MKRTAFLLLPPVVVAVLLGGCWWWRSHNVGPVQRGGALAARHGCLACHGPAGRPPAPHPAGTGGAPSFRREDVTRYARDESEIREWILDGKPRRLREEERDEPPPLLAMPAFRGVLTAREVSNLVEWVKAVSDFVRLPAEAAEGRDLAFRLGCFGCHGPQGRGDTPNPGSLKGYIPSWSGADYPELVRGEGELEAWIREGAPPRLRLNPVAAFFLKRQLVRMPAFGAAVSDEDIRKIARYIGWLRSGEPPVPPAPDAAPPKQRGAAWSPSGMGAPGPCLHSPASRPRGGAGAQGATRGLEVSAAVEHGQARSVGHRAGAAGRLAFAATGRAWLDGPAGDVDLDRPEIRRGRGGDGEPEAWGVPPGPWLERRCPS